MSEFIKNDNFEQQSDEQPTIEQLLPRYYETHKNIRYQILESEIIDGHEVAWMEYVATYGDSQAHKEISARSLHCACNFTEGTGWALDDKYGVVTIGSPERECEPRAAMKLMKLAEIKAAYLNQFSSEEAITDAKSYIKAVILDLIHKGKAGEFLGEDGEGARMWGGYFYLQTAQQISGAEWHQVWDAVYEMIGEGQIQLEGMVVQEYYEPPEPKWSEWSRYQYMGYTGVAKLPDHSKMPNEWRIAILGPDGKTAAADIKGPRLMYDPVFGPDAQDVDSVRIAIEESIEQFINDPMSQV